MTDIVVRFFIGGLIVSVFSLLSDLLTPKTFAGLFGAAPSVALATLGLTILKNGEQYAAVEARSMIIGAVALLVSAAAVSCVLLRFKFSALPVTMIMLLLWLGVASGLWYVMSS